MEHLNEDEIEFFGFIPVSFTNELQEDLQEALNDIVHNFPLHHRIQAYILDAFRKNLFIFSNFVLRNILKFPPSFRLERKVTDKTIHTNVPALLGTLAVRQERISQLSTALNGLRTRLAYEQARADGYRKLLENKARFQDLCTGAREIKGFLRETGELFEKYQAIGRRRDGEFERLMEYKNIKSEYYKNERGKLLEIADFEALEHLNKII